MCECVCARAPRACIGQITKLSVAVVGERRVSHEYCGLGRCFRGAPLQAALRMRQTGKSLPGRTTWAIPARPSNEPSPTRSHSSVSSPSATAVMPLPMLWRPRRSARARSRSWPNASRLRAWLRTCSGSRPRKPRVFARMHRTRLRGPNSLQGSGSNAKAILRA
jgi:hypothetical protein